MAALLETVGLDRKPRLDAEDVAFTLGPRLNAAGRLGQARLAVELLITDRPERAKELSAYVDGLNATRQTLERSIYLAAHKQAKEQYDLEKDPALVLADHGWHPGVIGIVAGRLAEKYHRPVVLISWDQLGVKPGIGSARSVPGFNLHRALESCGQRLVSYGGHAAAAGLRLHQRDLEAFRAEFCEYAASEISEAERVAELTVDGEAPLSAFTLQVVDQIEQLAPFGESNTRPLLCTSGVRLAEPPRTIGTGGRHLSMRLRQHDVTLRAVAFGGGEWADELNRVDRPLDVAFRPVINNFRGRRSVELHLVDWRPESRPEKTPQKRHEYSTAQTQNGPACQ
jgi:single-stranded-DNA-specific exonuclease